MLIAGHDFVNDVCATCGKKWLDIHDATMADLSKAGIAHQGLTNEKEIQEIMTEAARRREKLDWAMGWNKPKPRQDSDSGQNLDSALRPGAPSEMEVKPGIWARRADGTWFVPGTPVERASGWTRRADGYWVRDVPASDGTTVRWVTHLSPSDVSKQARLDVLSAMEDHLSEEGLRLLKSLRRAALDALVSQAQAMGEYE